MLIFFMEMQGVAVKMLAAGAEHTTAVTENGKLYGWGWGRYGNLGLGDREDRLVPAEVAAIAVWTQNSFPSHATCFPHM
jgi:alpha-tubulin suppressor-like RCC1 family protein